MSFDLLLDQFDRLVQSPTDVEILNQSILQWAVMGRLVPQDPNDEPAELLLERISAEKAELVKLGEIKRQKQDLVDPVLPMFDIPSGWSWTVLSNIANRIHYGYTASADTTLSEVRFLRITDIQNSRVHWSSVPGCSIEKKDVNKYRLKDNDILIARTGGTIGKSYLVEDLSVMAIFASYLIRVIPSTQYSARYLKLFLDSPMYWKQLKQRSKGTGQPNVNAKSLGNLKIPLPPLTEQRRIVTRVDELFEQTQELTDSLVFAESQRKKFHTSAIHRLTEAKTPKETRAAWHLIRDNFDRLYTEPETIDELKQAILQLAVMGRLVPQDPNDEPADVLLEQIAVERDDLIQQGHLKYRKAVPQIYGNDIPYPLPDGWLWVKLDQIASVVEYGTSQKSSLDSSGVPIIGMKSIQNGEVLLEGLKYVPSSINDLPRLYLKKFDLLFNRTNSYELVGKTGIFIGESKRYTLASYLIRISLFREFVNPHYINTYFNSLVCRVTQIEPEITQQTGQANFNGTKLRNVLIPLPPLQEQNRILAGVDKLFKQARELDTRLVTAESQRLTLLDAILSTW